MQKSAELVKDQMWGQKSLRVNNITIEGCSPAEINENVEVWLVPFISPLYNYFKYLPTDNTTFEGNLRYYLRFFIPKTKRANRLCVIINGLGESKPVLYDEIALEFAKQGTPSVLFPFPHHFHRNPDFVCNDEDYFQPESKEYEALTSHLIITRFINDPIQLSDAFIHAVYDMWNFTMEISNKITDPQNEILLQFLKEKLSWDKINPNPIHFLGYSLGGWIALGFKLVFDNTTSAILIESGANLGMADAGVILKRSGKRVETVLQKNQELKKNQQVDDIIKDIKELFVLNEDFCFHKKLFDLVTSSIKEKKSA